MKIEYLPTENDKSYTMYAYVDKNNEVIWNGCSSYDSRVIGTELSQFLVWRRGSIVIVEACAWHGPGFHFRLELTEEPYKVVILANETAALHERAYEG